MEMANVVVKQGALRSLPSFIGEIITNLSYGQSVEVAQKTNGWARVRVASTGQTGWMHGSALSQRPVTLKSGSLKAGHSATGDELALAGKGFNREVEQQFKAKNPGIDFAWVNTMENFTISDREMQLFLQEGQVTPRGGQS